MQLPIDLAKDQEAVVSKVLNLLSACVDVLSSEGHLNATFAMDMSQMVVQAMWDRDSPLLQIPHFTTQTVQAAAEYEIEDIEEFMAKMDPSENKDYQTLVKRLGLDGRQLVEAAAFTNNKYPNLDLDFELENPSTITANDPAYVKIRITRELDDDDDDNNNNHNSTTPTPAKEIDTTVHAPFYPVPKSENWWLVVSEPKTKSLLAIKRITIARQLELRLEFVVPSPGRKDLALSLVSDSYVGVDQEHPMVVEVAEGMDEDESEDEDGDEEGNGKEGEGGDEE